MLLDSSCTGVPEATLPLACFCNGLRRRDCERSPPDHCLFSCEAESWKDWRGQESWASSQEGLRLQDPSEPGGSLLDECLGVRVYDLFLAWVAQALSAEAGASLLARPGNVGELAKQFGFVLFEERHSLYMYRQLLTHLLRESPSVRPLLGSSWQLVSKWERLEPVEHRVPVPFVLLRAMASVRLLWDWGRFTAVLLLTFFGITQPGEVLKSKRRELLLPGDLIAESQSAMYLKILGLKTKFRGLGLVQHTKIDNLDVTSFCQKLCGPLPGVTALYRGSPAAF